MRAFITGITGFVGSHLAERLKCEGAEVAGLVRNLGDPKKLSNSPLGETSVVKELNLLEGELLDPRSLAKTIKEVRPDEIYHLASVSHATDSLKDPSLTFRINVQGTKNLLDAVLKSGASSKLLFVGSADSYGQISPDGIPIKEDYPIRPVSPYGLSKAAAERLVLHYVNDYGLTAFMVRPFNHIGPRQNPAYVCSHFARQVALIEAGKMKPVVYTGNLKVQRDFSDVRDVVRAYSLIMKQGVGGDIFNVCSGRSQPLEGILNKLIEFSGKEIEKKINPALLRKVDIPITRGDYSALKNRTGWEPAIPMEQTLMDHLDYFRQRL